MSGDKNATVLVISAHGADFVWHCGGTIAKSPQGQSKVHVVCPTLGQRGESEALWHDGARSEEDSVRVRTEESKEASKRLGATIDILASSDNPFTYDRDLCQRRSKIPPTHH